MRWPTCTHLLYGMLRSDHIVQSRIRKFYQELYLFLAKLKIITTLQCPDSSRQIFRTTKKRYLEVFLSGHPDMRLPATVRPFLFMEPFVQPLIASPEGFSKAQWPGRRLKLCVRPQQPKGFCGRPLPPFTIS